jgi:ATP-dependent helicase/nuclease subunit B
LSIAHFVNYGLRPAERKLYTVSNPDIGDIFHRSLLAFSEQLASSGTDWHCLGKTECEAITDRVMDQILEEHGHGIMDSSPRYRYLGQRLKRINRRAIWILTRQLQKGEFTPLGHELRFGSGGSLPPIGIELNDGGRFYVEGRIDRVDLWNTDEGLLLKLLIINPAAGNSTCMKSITD